MPKKSSKEPYIQELKIPKTILYTGKVLQALSLNWATKFAARIFATPIKYPMPQREWHMNEQSVQKRFIIPSINKEIVAYEYGKPSTKKILLVHGWSGRGTQLVKIADALVALGYQTISFDAPAHGKARGKITHMGEFIESILFLEKHYGPFTAAIGHSLGGMSLLNAIKRGLSLQKLVIIGSGDIVSDIVSDFVKTIQLKPIIAKKIQEYYQKKIGEEMNAFSASEAAKSVTIPVLVVHDEDDKDVPVSSAVNIHKHLKNGELYITKGLGHKKILGNGTVIDTICKYIKP